MLKERQLQVNITKGILKFYLYNTILQGFHAIAVQKCSALELDIMVRNRQDEYLAIIKQANDNVKRNVKYVDHLEKHKVLHAKRCMRARHVKGCRSMFWLLRLLGLSASDSR